MSHLGRLFNKVCAILKLHWEYIRKKKHGWNCLQLLVQAETACPMCTRTSGCFSHCPEKGTCERRRRKKEGLVDSGHPLHSLMRRSSFPIRSSVWERKNGKNYDRKYLYGAIFYVYPKLSNRLKYRVLEARLPRMLHVPDLEMTHLIS